jgi:carboxymethylenebutenolidase
MLIIEDGHVDIATETGPMRSYIFRPKPQEDAPEQRFPSLILYSEIFQMTGPVKRTACILAGFGFVVLVPEVYHELLEIGTVLTYTPEDSAKGNACKKDKALASYDNDFKCAFDFLTTYQYSTGAVGAAGMCLGGGLAFRAALVCPGIKACVCWYPTDLHTSGLSSGDDSLARCGEVKARMLMMCVPCPVPCLEGGTSSSSPHLPFLPTHTPLLCSFGTADPHIPTAGRRAIYDKMTEAQLKFQWHEVSGAHAFLRDENSYGRYDPVLALQTYLLATEHLARWLK